MLNAGTMLSFLALGLAVYLAGCSATVPPGPRDVGNMAYPAPLPAGTIAITRP